MKNGLLGTDKHSEKCGEPAHVFCWEVIQIGAWNENSCVWWYSWSLYSSRGIIHLQDRPVTFLDSTPSLRGTAAAEGGDGWRIHTWVILGREGGSLWKIFVDLKSSLTVSLMCIVNFGYVHTIALPAPSAESLFLPTSLLPTMMSYCFCVTPCG